MYFLLTFNFYRLANFNSFVTILAVVSYNTIKVSRIYITDTAT